MRKVQPIRDERIIEGMKQYFRQRCMRNYLFFCLGIYSGLRVSDLCNLQKRDVTGTHVNWVEKKNKNPKRFIIHPSVREDLDQFIAGLDDTDYLFASRQLKRVSRLKKQPIDRTTAYRFLNVAARQFGLREIGCHTLRKTWGYRLVKNAKQDEAAQVIALLMKMFNHSDPAITLDYIGITQDMMDRVISALR